jgi:hypothetical protein
MDLLKNEDLDSTEWLGLNWSNWRRLDTETQELDEIPVSSGLYRVRHPDKEGFEYIGETGNSLRQRIRHLAQGVRADEMPYRDPHTAAPCLWAILDKIGGKLEFSFCNPEISRSERDRKGLEAATIALNRKIQGESPTANFGRIIKGYKQSSYRKDGVIGGKEDTQDSEWVSLSPLDWSSKGSVKSVNWMGLDWSRPEKLDNRLDADLPNSGFYRIWFPNISPPLAYIGQTSDFQSRLRKHQKTFGDKAKFSVVDFAEADTHAERLELEEELIGAHFIQQNAAPKGQWGERNRYQ